MIGDTSFCLNSRPCSYYIRKRRKVSSTNIESLPDELLFDILVRVPADHLYHIARLVCRKWYLIIRSNAFINAHLHHSTYELILCPLSKWEGKPIFVTETQGQIETREFDYKCRNVISASCNGLALDFHFNNGMIFLHIINPATDQAFNLPSFDHCQPVILGCSRNAYTPASMVYKVILPHATNVYEVEAPCHYIVTVGVDDTWRRIETKHLPYHVYRLLESRPFSCEGGFIYWVDLCRGTNDVLTLNVETEVVTCSHVPLPQPQAYQSKYYLSAGKHLSLLGAHHDFSWDVWEMRPETGEWRKLFANFKLNMEPENQVLKPIGWVKYPEVLAFVFPNMRTCIFYNLDARGNNSIKLHHRFSGCKAFVHRNSLVWLT